MQPLFLIFFKFLQKIFRRPFRSPGTGFLYKDLLKHAVFYTIISLNQQSIIRQAKSILNKEDIIYKGDII